MFNQKKVLLDDKRKVYKDYLLSKGYCEINHKWRNKKMRKLDKIRDIFGVSEAQAQILSRHYTAGEINEYYNSRNDMGRTQEYYENMGRTQ